MSVGRRSRRLAQPQSSQTGKIDGSRLSKAGITGDLETEQRCDHGQLLRQPAACMAAHMRRRCLAAAQSSQPDQANDREAIFCAIKDILADIVINK